MNAPIQPPKGFQASIWSGQVTGPGLYLGVPEKIYHADPAPAPSLSSHVAKIALKRSADHAKAAHPRLADPIEDEEDDEDEAPKTPAAFLLIGQAAHSLMLGAGAPVVEIPVKAFRTKEAKERRALVLAHGGIPLKSAHYRAAKRMAEIARPVFREEMGGEFIPEAMLVWQSKRGMWRRGLVDGCAPNLRTAGDYKTSGRPCPPAVAAQFVNANGYPFQERFYNRGFDALDPDGEGRRRFFFMFQEVEYPHAISIVETDEANRSLADEQVAAACNIWDRALVTGEWPSYPRTPHIATPKGWDLTEWEQRAMTDESLNPMEMEA